MTLFVESAQILRRDGPRILRSHVLLFLTHNWTSKRDLIQITSMPEYKIPSPSWTWFLIFYLNTFFCNKIGTYTIKKILATFYRIVWRTDISHYCEVSHFLQTQVQYLNIQYMYYTRIINTHILYLLVFMCMDQTNSFSIFEHVTLSFTRK